MASKKVDIPRAVHILKGIHGGTKTKVSIAMELAAKLPIRIEFTESGELRWNPGIFKYNALLGDITASGTGGSKKEAKQNSAENLLEIIRKEAGQTSNANENETTENIPVTPVRNPYLSPPSSISPSPSNMNAVGELQTIAQKKGWELPVYSYTASGDQPHCQTYSCSVTMCDLSFDARGSNKKSAKKRAAEEMLKYIQNGVDEIHAPVYSPGSPYGQTSSPETSLLDSSDMEDYQSCTSDSPPMEDIDDELATNVIDQGATLMKLKSKSTLENFKYEFIHLPNLSKKGLYQVFLKLTFDDGGRPLVVTHGSGETTRIAEAAAADRGLKHLEVVMALP